MQLELFDAPEQDETPVDGRFARLTPHCLCGCTSAMVDGTPTGDCDCYMVHPQFMHS